MRFKDHKILKRIFSTGFFAYIIICIFIMIADHNRIFSMWDELQHWGKMVKEMIRLDDFYSVPASTLPNNNDYPPFISCFEMFWTVMANGAYSEAGVSVGMHVFLFSLLVPPVLDENKRNDSLLNKFLRPLIVLAGMVLLLMITDISNVLFTIYTDVLIAAIFCWVLYLVYTQEAMKSVFGFCAFSIGMTGLIMSKQISILFAATAAAAYILTALFFMPGWKKKGIAVLKLIAMCILPAVFYLGWNHYISSLNVTGLVSNTEDLGAADVIVLLQRTGEEYQVGCVEKITDSFMNEQYLNTPFTVSAFTVMIACAVMMLVHGVLFQFVLKKKTEAVFWKDLLFAAGMCLCTVLYVIAMICVYAFFFEAEESSFGSLTRYISTITISLSCFVFLIYLKSILEMKDWKPLVLCAVPAIAFAVINPSMIQTELPDHSGVNPNQRYKDVADYIQEHVEPNKSVLIVFTSPYVNDWRMKVSYYVDGIYIKGNSKNIMGIEFTDNPDEIAAMGNRFASADYVYIEDATGTFNWNCREFSETEEYAAGGLYSVSTEPTTKLKLIGINENNPDPQFWQE